MSRDEDLQEIDVTTTATPGYGARPVSMDLTRGRALTETVEPRQSPVVTQPSPGLMASDLHGLRWPLGHPIIVWGLDGGTGRSTVASLIAATLAESNDASGKPVALVELQPRTLSHTRRRWLSGLPTAAKEPAADGYRPPVTRSGIMLPAAVPAGAQRAQFSALVVEMPADLPTDRIAYCEPSTSLVLVVRPDRRSLADAAEALVWMQDRRSMERGRMLVVVNLGTGPGDRGTRAMSTALGVRCRAVHRLPRDRRLGPTGCLPSGSAVPTSLRPLMTAVCLDLWRSCQPPNRSSRPTEEVTP